MTPRYRDGELLEHMLAAIAKIHRYIGASSEDAFMANELVQDGVLRNLEIIGEAVSKLSLECRQAHQDVPWGEIAGMRNRLIHGYMSVNLQIVWDTVQEVLPKFRSQIRAIAHTLPKT